MMKQFLKKAFSLLCAALMAGAAIPARADELPLSANYLAEEFSRGIYKVNSSSLGYQDGKLLFVSDAQLISLHPATGEADSRVLPLPEGKTVPGLMGLALLPQGNQLRLLDIDRGLLYPLSLREGKPVLSEPLALDWQDYSDLYYDAFGDPKGMQPPLDFLLTDDKLWVMQEDTSFEIGPYFWLTRFDLESGKEERSAERFSVGAITPYKDGKLLITTPMSFTESGEFEMGDYAVLDPEDMSVDALFPIQEGMNPWAMSYIEASDTLFIAVGTRLYRLEGMSGEARVCSDLPNAAHSGRLFLLGPDQIAYINNAGIALTDANAERFAGKTPLVFLGSFYQGGAQETIAQLSQYRITMDFTGLPYAERMLTDKSGFDLALNRPEEISFRAIMQKDYALDLSAVPGVKDYIGSLYPALREAVMADGRVYGIPVDLMGWVIGYDKAFFEDIGRQPPKTFLELVSFVAGWQESYGEDYPNRSPLTAADPRGILVRQAIEVYQSQMAIGTDAFTWDSPLLRGMLSAVDGLNVPKMSDLDPWEEGYPAPVIETQFAVSSVSSMKGVDNGPASIVMYPSPLSADEGMYPAFKMNISILFANAASLHGEAALALIERYVPNIPKASRAMMSPAENEPLPNPWYHNPLRDMERRLAALQDAASQSEGAQQREMTAQAEAYAEETEGFRAKEQWAAGEADIKAYRALAKHGFVAQKGGLISLWELNDTVERYIARQIGMEQFIQEMENKTRLMTLENQ